MPEKIKPKKSTEPGRSLSFEQALGELEKTIERLEAQELTLDTALEQFERGIVLLRTCDDHLKKAQGRVTELLKNENGDYVEKVLGTTLDAFVRRDDDNA